MPIWHKIYYRSGGPRRGLSASRRSVGVRYWSVPNVSRQWHRCRAVWSPSKRLPPGYTPIHGVPGWCGRSRVSPPVPCNIATRLRSLAAFSAWRRALIPCVAGRRTLYRGNAIPQRGPVRGYPARQRALTPCVAGVSVLVVGERGSVPHTTTISRHRIFPHAYAYMGERLRWRRLPAGRNRRRSIPLRRALIPCVVGLRAFAELTVPAAAATFRMRKRGRMACVHCRTRLALYRMQDRVTVRLCAVFAFRLGSRFSHPNAH